MQMNPKQGYMEQDRIKMIFLINFLAVSGAVIKKVHKLNTITACFLIGMSVIKLIKNADAALRAAVIVPRVCFMPCMAATGSWELSWRWVTKE